MIQLDEHIFQMAWNHQPEYTVGKWVNLSPGKPHHSYKRSSTSSTPDELGSKKTQKNREHLGGDSLAHAEPVRCEVPLVEVGGKCYEVPPKMDVFSSSFSELGGCNSRYIRLYRFMYIYI